MRYTPYGKTGIHVSAIGFGGMRFADQTNSDECAELLQTAYNKGINYFDTAPGYGDSEKLFGVAFKEMLKTREEKPFYVSTKTMKSEPSEIRAQLEESLERMGLDYIDFYHMWCVMDLDAYNNRKAQGALKEFERLRDEGLIRNIVVSSHMSGGDIGEVLEDYPFEGALLGYSVMNSPYREKALDAAARLNRGIVAMNPLGGGIIPQNPDRFEFLRTQKDETVVEAALRFLLNDPRITVSLVGFSTIQQLNEALSAMDGFQPISDNNMARIFTELKSSFDSLCTSCSYCDSCPENIPIPKLMDAYNQYALTGKIEDILNRLQWHWGMSPDQILQIHCTKCGRCENLCTQKLPICERIDTIIQAAKDKIAANT